MNSKVSIILPNYNHAHYLQTSLDAIFSQSVKPFEVIVIDDCSTDNSLNILAEYERKNKNLKVVKNLENKGTASSVNLGIEIATGKYLAFCSADDHIEQNFIEVLVNCLEKDKNLALCTSDFCTFKNNDMSCLKINRLLKTKEQVVIQPGNLAKMIKGQLFWIPTNASLYRKKHLQEFVGLDDRLKWMSDWFLNYQIAFRYPVAYIPKALTGFRVLESSYSHLIKNEAEAFDNLFHSLKIQTKDFQKFFQKSGVLYQQGRKALYYVLSHPKKWSYLLPVLRNVFKYKLKKS